MGMLETRYHMRRTALLCLGCVTLAFALSSISAGQDEHANPLVPTTTMSHETANNTSASPSFLGQENGNATASNISKVPLRTLLPADYNGKIFVHYMPWWGNRSHPDIGYSEHDSDQIRRQVEDMISRGFDGVIVGEWNSSDFSRDTSDKLFRECEAHSFLFAIQESKHAMQHGNPTGKLIDDLNYAARKYFRSPAYYKVNGRPVVYFFDSKIEGVDWRRAQDRVEGHPLFIFRNPRAFQLDYSDGGFAWIGHVKGGDPDGLKYLESFYKAAREHSGMYAMGAGWKGFDDHLARWGKNQLDPQACGVTWLKSFTLADHFFPGSRMPDLCVNTWNDYEEGTEVESGIDNCASINARVEGHSLRLDPHFGSGGTEETVDHYEVFVSANGRDLSPLAALRTGAHKLDLSRFQLAPGAYTFFVKMVGRPLMINHMSPAIAYVVNP
jgi:hypothetical protein